MSLNSGECPSPDIFTLPQYIDKSERLIEKLRKFNPDEIADKMRVNDKLALMNYFRFQQWDKEHSLRNSTHAILAYTGEAYRGLKASDFSSDDLVWSQGVLRILSGLYGMLKPLDLIQPYRLEMGLNIPLKGIGSLYDYWKGVVTTSLNKAIEASPGEKVLINLASVEYSSVIDFTNLKFPVITPSFKEEKSGRLKMVTVYTKRARGAMVRFIIQNRIKNSEEIKAFTDEGYYFGNQLSKGSDWLFVR